MWYSFGMLSWFKFLVIVVFILFYFAMHYQVLIIVCLFFICCLLVTSYVSFSFLLFWYILFFHYISFIIPTLSRSLSCALYLWPSYHFISFHLSLSSHASCLIGSFVLLLSCTCSSISTFVYFNCCLYHIMVFILLVVSCSCSIVLVFPSSFFCHYVALSLLCVPLLAIFWSIFFLNFVMYLLMSFLHSCWT